MAPIPREYHVDRNGTVFIQCQASYDASNLDLVYVWKFNGELIDFGRDTLLRKVWTFNDQRVSFKKAIDVAIFPLTLREQLCKKI